MLGIITKKLMNIAEKVQQLTSNFNSTSLKLGIMQLYSMRSYKDNLYNPCADGNMNHTFHEVYNMLHVLKLPISEIRITVPLQISDTNLQQYRTLWDTVIGDAPTIVEYVFVEYGENVAKTRDAAPAIFSTVDFSDCNCIVCDFELMSDFKNPDIPVIYRFNVTKLVTPNQKQGQFEKVLSGKPVSVFNGYQLITFYGELGTTGNAFKSTNWFNPELVWKFAQLVQTPTVWINESKFVLIPFRLTDPDYRIQEILDWCEKHPDYEIYGTDPNDTIQKFPQIKKLDLNKAEFYRFCAHHQDQMKIFYLIDPREVLHQLFLEFLVLCPKSLETELTQEDIETIKQTYFVQ